MDVAIPKVTDLLWPTVEAMRALGGSGHITEISERVVATQGYSEEQQAILQPGKNSMSKIDYRLHWARSYLKNIGVVESSSRGVWALTALGAQVSDHEVQNLVKEWKKALARERSARGSESHNEDDGSSEDGPAEADWKSTLIQTLLVLEPAAFERLCQRLLREAGFRDVEVTASGSDGGIDGSGVYRPSLVSFPVYFQCKRYQGSVRSAQVRDFRGAMEGRGEKGLLITTGTFTRDARDESTRVGATTIDLIDGEDLCELLKQYGLGVTVETRTVEEVTIDSDFFQQF